MENDFLTKGQAAESETFGMALNLQGRLDIILPGVCLRARLIHEQAVCVFVPVIAQVPFYDFSCLPVDDCAFEAYQKGAHVAANIIKKGSRLSDSCNIQSTCSPRNGFVRVCKAGMN
jgi:hypothetical protein